MKVTAILPDQLISEVRTFSNGDTITESLKIALNEWVKLQKIKKLNKETRQNPLQLKTERFTKIREINRSK